MLIAVCKDLPVIRIAETNQRFPFQVHYASVDKIPAEGDRSGVVLR